MKKKINKEQVEQLEKIADLASKAAYKLRFNNKLWANAVMVELEAALEEAGLYTKPVDQG